MVITKTNKLLLCCLCCLTLVLISLTAIEAEVIPDLREKDCIYFFYGQGSQENENTNSYLYDFNLKYTSVKIQRYEVYFNQENKQLLSKYYQHFELSADKQSIPFLIIGNSYLMGEKSIKALLEGRIKENYGTNCPLLLQENKLGVAGEGSPAELFNKVTLLKTTTASASGILNPGAIILILILLLILSSKEKSRIYHGLIFVLGIFFTYLLFYFGLFDFFSYYQNSILILRIIAVILILITLIKLIALFNSWKQVTKKFSWETKTKYNQHLKNLFSYISIYILGLIVSLLTLSQVYNYSLLVRNLYLGGFKPLTMFFIVIYYNLVFIFPFALLLIIYYFLNKRLNKYSEEVMQERSHRSEKWYQFYLRVLNLIIYIIVLILAIIIIV